MYHGRAKSFVLVCCFHSVFVNHICEVPLIFAVVTAQEIKQRDELAQLLFCVILKYIVWLGKIYKHG
jgi:hypothetical protein